MLQMLELKSAMTVRVENILPILELKSARTVRWVTLTVQGILRRVLYAQLDILVVFVARVQITTTRDSTGAA